MNEKVADIKCPACKKKAELILNLFINDKGFICNKCKKLIVSFTCNCGKPFKKIGKTLWCKDCNISTSTSQFSRGLQSVDLLQKLYKEKQQAEAKLQDEQGRFLGKVFDSLPRQKKGEE